MLFFVWKGGFFGWKGLFDEQYLLVGGYWLVFEVYDVFEFVGGGVDFVYGGQYLVVYVVGFFVDFFVVEVIVDCLQVVECVVEFVGEVGYFVVDVLYGVVFVCLFEFIEVGYGGGQNLCLGYVLGGFVFDVYGFEVDVVYDFLLGDEFMFVQDVVFFEQFEVFGVSEVFDCVEGGLQVEQVVFFFGFLVLCFGVVVVVEDDVLVFFVGVMYYFGYGVGEVGVVVEFVLEFVGQLFDVFGDDGVEYCYWKGNVL